MPASYSTTPATVVVRYTGNQGVLAGLLGCVFGVLGIFFAGIVFVPLAAICSLIGLLRGASGPSAVGIGCSLLGSVLTIWGFVVSPTLWILMGAGILAAHQPAQAIPKPVPSIEGTRAPAVERDRAVAELNPIIDRMVRFNKASETVVARLVAAEERYRALTAQMGGYLGRMQELAGIPNAGLARSQLRLAMNQSSLATNALHIELMPTYRDFQNNVIPFRAKAVQEEQTCRGAHLATSENPVTPDVFLWNATCLTFRDVATHFHQRSVGVGRGVSALVCLGRWPHQLSQNPMQIRAEAGTRSGN